MGQRAAFFDLDKTLIPGSSLFLLARGMYARDYYRVRDIARFGWRQLVFRMSGETDKGLESARESTLEFVAGRPVAELEEMGREIAEERILPRVYEGITKVIDQHRGHGDLTYLCTASPQEVADLIAESLEMTGALGTQAELSLDGRYTGRLGPRGVLHGPAKAEAVKEMAARDDIDLDECFAYSDSINDLPLLELVGHPVAVNPDKDLKREARSRGWPVYELRTRRPLLLFGIPSAFVAAGLFGGGVAVGSWMGSRRAQRELASRSAFARALRP
jgi:HAD superfamily hydrolase (TIGR01490 family)